MLVNFNCPSCNGRLSRWYAENKFRCLQCGQIVVETVEETGDHVRAFFQRATGRATL